MQMVPFAGYELPVLYDTEWGGIVKGAYGMRGFLAWTSAPTHTPYPIT